MSEKPMTLDELFATHRTEQQLQFEREQIPGTPEHAEAEVRRIADAARRADEALLVVDEPEDTDEDEESEGEEDEEEDDEYAGRCCCCDGTFDSLIDDLCGPCHSGDCFCDEPLVTREP